jgi:hypothetical protein
MNLRRVDRWLAALLLGFATINLPAQQQTPTPPGAPEPHRPVPVAPPIKTPPEIPPRDNRTATASKSDTGGIVNATNRPEWMKLAVFAGFAYLVFAVVQVFSGRFRKRREEPKD